jgi:hypothetical protein
MMPGNLKCDQNHLIFKETRRLSTPPVEFYTSSRYIRTYVCYSLLAPNLRDRWECFCGGFGLLKVKKKISFILRVEKGLIVDLNYLKLK